MRRGFCLGQNDERQCSFCRTGRTGPVRDFRWPAHHSRAGRLCARPCLCADPFDRAAPVDHDARAGDLQRLQFVHPAGGAVLPADRQPDEHRRHHRPPGRVVALDGRALAGIAGADQCRAVGVLCRHLRLLHRGCGEPVQNLHRCPDQGRLRSLVLDRHHCGLRRARRHHPALDPDDRVGRTDLDLDRCDVPRRHRAGIADRRRADGDRACLCGASRLSDLSERELASICAARSGGRYRR